MRTQETGDIVATTFY